MVSAFAPVCEAGAVSRDIEQQTDPLSCRHHCVIFIRPDANMIVLNHPDLSHQIGHDTPMSGHIPITVASGKARISVARGGIPPQRDFSPF